MQLGFAAGAAIGGIVVGGSSILMTRWIGAAALAVVVIMFGFAYTFSKKGVWRC